MKAFCDRHSIKEYKNRLHMIHVIGRVLPSQALTEEQSKCFVKGCKNPVGLIFTYIADMNIRVVPRPAVKEEPTISDAGNVKNE